ncbi:MAG: tryptophan-rich hypothetical protein [Colwellia sp.]|jgi:tryptophan-rich hypothetical protein|tara:strand:- start:1911 stop:2147 length:237 start_codon:yes stop_codon:yes gene_type:complete
MKSMNENINKISPKSLIHSKWTKVDVTNKEKHFIITVVKFDEDKTVVSCLIEAVMTKNEYAIDWRELKDKNNWKIGWQ